ncbi:hypothetical protein PoB_005159900 [Plakobranchus ocellatus]|uniref:Uncharacterized protein n=1 Tax=Plakobranchus ocellatus TaxID=259542 RepID=A0AAV4C342_9GAST|nr:hypothetical protein PoB_005159900 [Plakobranchus ocellatus]
MPLKQDYRTNRQAGERLRKKKREMRRKRNLENFFSNRDPPLFSTFLGRAFLETLLSFCEDSENTHRNYRFGRRVIRARVAMATGLRTGSGCRLAA